MTDWVIRGLRSGMRSSKYPRQAEPAAGVSPGRPVPTPLPPVPAAAAAAVCPAAALTARGQGVSIDYEHCLHCQRCQRSAPAMNWDTSYEWAALSATSSTARLANVFGRSLHVRFVDAGACGACLAEARLLDNPQYNLHRLGIFITPTPRTADVLLVAGPVTENMRAALVNTYEAMPAPKRVVAMGVCALNGGIFSQSFATLGGAATVIPVDVVIPGCPPPPLAILHGLLLAVGRVSPAALQADPASTS